MKTIKALFRLCIAFLAWNLAGVRLLANKASCWLISRLVDKETRDISVQHKINKIDYRQKLVDILDVESEVIVGMVRERLERTNPGLTVMRHVSDRHPYAVAYPTKQENITRILNVLDLFPAESIENTYQVLCRGIEKIHSTGDFSL